MSIDSNAGERADLLINKFVGLFLTTHTSRIRQLLFPVHRTDAHSASCPDANLLLPLDHPNMAEKSLTPSEDAFTWDYCELYALSTSGFDNRHP